MTLHGRDDRLGEIGELIDHLEIVVGLRVRPDLAQHLAHVVTGGEVAAGTAQDHQTYGLGLALERIDMLLQRLDELFRESIEPLGAVEGEDRGARMILPQYELAHRTATPESFHQPPPRAWNKPAVSA